MSKMVEYRLTRPFFDGRSLHPRGSILPFPEGKAPKSALRIEEFEAKQRAKERADAEKAKKKAAAELAAAEKRLEKSAGK